MYKVVIIDDEYWTVKGIEASCQWSQYDCKVVYTNTSPVEGLAYILDHEVDFLFIDVNMDEMSGLEVIEKLRKKGHDIDCVIISGYSEFEYAQTALGFGVSEYILKPIDKEIFSSTVAKLVQKKRNQLEQVNLDQEPLGSFEKLLHNQYTSCKDLFEQDLYRGYQSMVIQGEEEQVELEEILKISPCQYLKYNIGQAKYLFILQLDGDFLEGGQQLLTQDRALGVSSYKESTLDLQSIYFEGDIAFCESFILGPKMWQYQRIPAQGRKLLNSLTEQEFSQFKEVLRRLMKQDEIYGIEEYVLLYNCIASFCNYYHSGQAVYKMITYDEICDGFKNIEDFLQHIIEMLSNINKEEVILETTNGMKEKEGGFQQILDYIDSHYKETLYLSDVAQ